VAVPAFFGGLFWSATHGPSTTHADLSIGLGSAFIAACVVLICLRRVARHLSEQARRMTGLAFWMLGSTSLVLFALIVIH
jgi:hypothetical protein